MCKYIMFPRNLFLDVLYLNSEKYKNGVYIHFCQFWGIHFVGSLDDFFVYHLALKLLILKYFHKFIFRSMIYFSALHFSRTVLPENARGRKRTLQNSQPYSVQVSPENRWRRCKQWLQLHETTTAPNYHPQLLFYYLKQGERLKT